MKREQQQVHVISQERYPFEVSGQNVASRRSPVPIALVGECYQ
ncbi:MAG: hypothetical protein OSA08_09980 [Arenicellales bacterium]|nr:hypothetical protein [Arenicellales bacterium]